MSSAFSKIPPGWADYFSSLERHKGHLLSDMRQIVIKELRSFGLKQDQIAKFMGFKHHSTVIYYLKRRVPTKDYDAVKGCYLDWIRDGVYPYGVNMGSKVEGFSLTFKMVKI
jgi:hypothetical protein